MIVKALLVVFLPTLNSTDNNINGDSTDRGKDNIAVMNAYWSESSVLIGRKSRDFDKMKMAKYIIFIYIILTDFPNRSSGIFKKCPRYTKGCDLIVVLC